MYYQGGSKKVGKDYLQTYHVFKIGDIAYEGHQNKKHAFGRFVENTIGNGIVSHVFDVYTPTAVRDLFFWKYYINNEHLMRPVLRRSTKSATMMHNIVDQDLRKATLLVPDDAEQKAIGSLLHSLDANITLHQRKLEKLKKLKKGLLQKLFPKNGEVKPEVRFTGYTNDWKQRKLTEFVEFYNGQTYTPLDVQDTGTLILRSSNIKNGEVVDADNVYIIPEKTTAKNVKVGDIIVVVRNGSRALIGKHAEIQEDMPNTVIGAFMTGIRCEHSSFLNALLGTNHFQKEIEKNMGATINQITGYMFSKMEFMIPSDAEQEIVGKCFKAIDSFITLHQRELELLKNVKKGFLQKLFVNDR